MALSLFPPTLPPSQTHSTCVLSLSPSLSHMPACMHTHMHARSAQINRRCGFKVCVTTQKMAVLQRLGFSSEQMAVFTTDQEATPVYVVGYRVRESV
jgi:hypothetical protein